MKKAPKKPIKVVKKQKLNDPYKVGQKFLKMIDKFADEHNDVLKELVKR